MKKFNPIHWNEEDSTKLFPIYEPEDGVREREEIELRRGRERNWILAGTIIENGKGKECWT